MNKKKKICYVLPDYNPQDATHFSHIHDLLKRVAQYVDLFLVVEKGGLPDRSLGYTGALLIGTGGILRVLKTWLTFLRLRVKGYKDVYVHYSFASAFAASCIMRPSGGRVFYWNCGEPWKYERSFLREYFERLTYRTISYLVTGAHSLAKEYSIRYRFKEEKTKVMPNWIDLKRFSAPQKEESRKQLGIPQNIPVVLFVHRISRRKGAHLILPIAEKVLVKKPDTLFLVVGSGPDQEKLEKEVKGSGKETQIRFVGAKPNSIVPTYIRASDVFLMPSEEEGFPRVLLETMALGVPFVASDVGAVKEIIPRELISMVLPYGDISAFSSSILKILSMSIEERDRMVQIFSAHIQNYTVEKVSQKFLSLFE